MGVMKIFQGLTGGLDWHIISEPLIREVSPLAGIAFCIFMAFVTFGVMNVVTAFVVEGVIQYEAKARELHKFRTARRLFKELGLDRNQSIEFEDIEEHFQDPNVQAFFRSIDCEPREARCLFDLLDVRHTGSMEFEEFITGCIRLQSNTKSSDLMLAMRDLRRFISELMVEVLGQEPDGEDDDRSYQSEGSRLDARLS